MGVREIRLALPALVLSVVGDAMAFVALTLRVHGSGAGPYAVAALLLCFSLPVVATMGVAGALADRLDPPLLIGVAALGQALASLGLATSRSLPATFALVVVLQLGFSVTNPTLTSVLTRAVGDEHLGQLTSLQQALYAAASPIGAALGGVIVQSHGDAMVFVIDASSYIVLATPALGLGRGVVLPVAAWRSERLPFLPRDGWRAVHASPLASALLWALLPFVVTLESMNAVEVFLVRDELGGTDADFGFWQALAGAGALVGALLGGVITSDHRRVKVVVGCLTAMSALQIGVGVAPSLGWLFILGAALGLANSLSNAALVAVFIRAVAPDLRGRAIALLNGLARATSLLALGLGGFAGAQLGPRLSFVVAGIAGLLVAARAWRALRKASLEPTIPRAPRPAAARLPTMEG